MSTRRINYNIIIWPAIVIFTYWGFVTFNCSSREPEEKDHFQTKDSFRIASDDVIVPFLQVMTGEPIALEQDDDRIINYIWENKYLEPPSTEPYNLEKPDEDPSHGHYETMRKILGNMTNGFFVECGGFDGETHSNTLYMERFLNWKGLMIEADPKNYAMLKKKNRKSYTANACLSVHPFPHQVEFIQGGAGGRILSNNSDPNIEKTVKVQCFPIFTFLTALKVKTVDFFGLDVEGSELKILKTIPFDRVFIRTMSVEFNHIPEGKEALIDFMASKNYEKVYEVNVRWLVDVVFVHRDAFNITVINKWK